MNESNPTYFHHDQPPVCLNEAGQPIVNDLHRQGRFLLDRIREALDWLEKGAPGRAHESLSEALNPGHKEADITISGQPLTQSQSLTLRVACNCFRSFLDDEGLGNERNIEKAYQSRLDEIMQLLRKTCS